MAGGLCTKAWYLQEGQQSPMSSSHIVKAVNAEVFSLHSTVMITAQCGI